LVEEYLDEKKKENYHEDELRRRMTEDVFYLDGQLLACIKQHSQLKHSKANRQF